MFLGIYLASLIVKQPVVPPDQFSSDNGNKGIPIDTIYIYAPDTTYIYK